MHGRERTLGQDHADTLYSRHWLGLTLYKQNKYSKAEELLRQAVHGRERTLGQDHAETLATVHLLQQLQLKSSLLLPKNVTTEHTLAGRLNSFFTDGQDHRPVSRMSRRLRHKEYTVGWICALSVELAAAQEMLDEEHDDLERDDNDENLYSLGSIAGHNVVIVCLPAGRIGNNPAAAVATQMRATFKGIRFGLMVGIGGGVPSAEADIRLGDVVVSQPHQTFGGVIQYDIGKTTPSGFERTGSLNFPPQILLAAAARVRANELRGRSRLSKHVSMLDRIHRFQRDRAGPDVLFEATYDHEGGQTCHLCNTDKQEARQSRESEEAVVHYGTITSGNQVMRDGRTRDKLSNELGGILCFEMEAAGLMNSFPCLVIRGICDYADSHKNKTWQPYAAGTAAAYAKEVLSVIPPTGIAKTRTAEETV